MNNSLNYIMVWIDEEEKWYYFMNKFDENQFKDGFVDYCITVENGLIVEDSFKPNNKGKVFSDMYDTNLWN